MPDRPTPTVPATLQDAYTRLLDMHMGTLLTHGPQVAQGLALAIGVIHEMLTDTD